jgi:hypothetical protein
MADSQDNQSLNQDDIKPWERQPGETDDSYQAFRCFLYLPLWSTYEAYKIYQQQKGKTVKAKAKCPPGYFSTWKKEHKWVDRKRAYLHHLGRKEQASFEDFVIQRDQALNRYRVSRIENATLLQESARELLAYARQKLQQARSVEESIFKNNGELIQELTPAVAAKLMNLYGLSAIAAGYNAATAALKQATDEFAHCESVAQTQRVIDEIREKLSNGKFDSKPQDLINSDS